MQCPGPQCGSLTRSSFRGTQQHCPVFPPRPILVRRMCSRLSARGFILSLWLASNLCLPRRRRRNPIPPRSGLQRETQSHLISRRIKLVVRNKLDFLDKNYIHLSPHILLEIACGGGAGDTSIPLTGCDLGHVQQIVANWKPQIADWVKQQQQQH
jgi:hypothetical protein